MNWRLAFANIREAREELEALEKLAVEKTRNEVSLELGLEHAYHHLNVAWRARRVSESRYSSLSVRDFKSWRRFPKDLHDGLY